MRKAYGYKAMFWYANGAFNQIVKHLSDYEVNLGENLILGMAFLAKGNREKATSALESDM